MEAKTIKLKVEERKALEGIIGNTKAARKMLKEGARMLEDNEQKMWDIINSLYPQKENENDRSFNHADFEIHFFTPTNKQERYKMLKEKAVNDRDFEKASKYRDLERKERDKR